MKRCSKCKQIKSLTYFNKDKIKVDGYYSSCKECVSKKPSKIWSKEERRLYYVNHKEVILKKQSIYYQKNKSNRLNSQKNYYKNNRVDIRKRAKSLHRLNPWNRLLTSITQRCGNVNNPRYKNYGGRGIKNFLTKKDLQFLWERDKANLLREPSIDRIDKNWHYELNNCRFIENKLNSELRHKQPYYHMMIEYTI